jgi:YfiH family protein
VSSKEPTTVEAIRASNLGEIAHGFLGRCGGVSSGALWGLNVGLGSDDHPDAIAENRSRAIEAVLPGAKLATVHQVHSPHAVYAQTPWPSHERPNADALVTDRPDLLLGVLTADCAPVLLADAEAGVIGAAHAGWRGALTGVTDSAVRAMEKLGAKRSRINAAVGPCIGLESYEVDDAFRNRFLDAEPLNEQFFAKGPAGKPHFDLSSYVANRLRSAGLAAVEQLSLDTYASEERFFSYRRATHRGESNYGRQISMIGLAH